LFSPTEFSEPLRATGSLASSVVLTAGATTVRCDPIDLSAPVVYPGFELLCASVASVSTLQVRFEGFASASGAPLLTASGASPDYTIEPARLPETGGCRPFVPSPAPAP
jgi:hypothetical protein